ncbi:MAG: hypothetical protein ABW190_00510 [Rhizobacter sp.]
MVRTPTLQLMLVQLGRQGNAAMASSTNASTHQQAAYRHIEATASTL